MSHKKKPKIRFPRGKGFHRGLRFGNGPVSPFARHLLTSLDRLRRSTGPGVRMCVVLQIPDRFTFDQITVPDEEVFLSRDHDLNIKLIDGGKVCLVLRHPTEHQRPTAIEMRPSGQKTTTATRADSSATD